MLSPLTTEERDKITSITCTDEKVAELAEYALGRLGSNEALPS
jgi:hypothetical protein